MIQRILNRVNGKIEGLHEAAYVLAAFALGSHLLALVRDRLLAHYFGAGIQLDIYYAAFRIPDFIFVSIASLVSLFVIIPFLLERETEAKEEARAFLSTLFSGFFISISLVSVVIFFFVPQLTGLLFPGISEGSASELLITLTRIMLLSPILLGISNIYAAVTQTEKHFFVYALTPLLYNIGIILGIILFYPLYGLEGLAWGVVLGAGLHMLVQMPTVLKTGFFPTFVLPDWRVFFEVVKISLPRTTTLALNQLVFLALLFLASFMAEGSISVLNFGFNIQGVPFALIGVSYSVAAFPTLVRLFSTGEREKFFDQMVAALRHIIFWSLPAAALFIVLRAQIVRTALGSGAFSWADTRLTAATVALFVVSLVAQGIEMLIVRGYYAAGLTKKPLIVKIAVSSATIIGALLLVLVFRENAFTRYFIESLLRVDDIEGTVVLMLALAYSIGTFISAGLLWYIFERDFKISLPRSLYQTLFHSFLSAVASGAIAYIGLQVLAPLLDQETFIGIFSQGVFAGILGITAGIVVLLLLQNREIKEMWRSLHSRFWENAIVVPEIEEMER
jgi:putative peptidoglycan lipid II flippase